MPAFLSNLIRTGEVPPAVRRRPELIHLDRLPFAIYHALNRERIALGEMGGSFIFPIKSSDVVGYCRTVMGIQDDETIEEMCFLVAEMDDEYIDCIHRKRSSKLSSPSAG